MNKDRIVCFGEMLLRLNCPSNQRFGEARNLEMLYGGSEANVAVLLARVGLEVEYLTRLPDNDLGSAVLELLRQNGVGTKHILKGGQRLGLYFSETGNSLRATRIIYDRAHSGFANLRTGMIDWPAVFSDAGWFHWSGISPALSDAVAEVCAEGLEEASRKGLRISADFNHRSTLWNYGKHPSGLMPGLLENCDTVTADMDAASIYFGIKSPQKANLREAAAYCGEELMKRLPRVRTLAMSLRQYDSAGCLQYSGMLMTRDQTLFQDPYSIHQPLGRIGSGDAFTGGLLYGLIKKLSPSEILAFATASGALKHSIVSDIPLFGLSEVMSLISGGSSHGRVIR